MLCCSDLQLPRRMGYEEEYTTKTRHRSGCVILVQKKRVPIASFTFLTLEPKNTSVCGQLAIGACVWRARRVVVVVVRDLRGRKNQRWRWWGWFVYVSEPVLGLEHRHSSQKKTKRQVSNPSHVFSLDSKRPRLAGKLVQSKARALTEELFDFRRGITSAESSSSEGHPRGSSSGDVGVSCT